MNSIEQIKEQIKEIQKNFNPEKATYKILNDILTEDYNPKEMMEYMGTIKGVDKYPLELKNSFLDIIKDLKELNMEKVEENKEEKEENKEENKEEKENTKELKAIINALEDTAKQQKIEDEQEEVEIKEEVDLKDGIISDETETLEEVIEVPKDDSTVASKVFKIVLAIVILCVLVAVGLVLFY